ALMCPPGGTAGQTSIPLRAGSKSSPNRLQAPTCTVGRMTTATATPTPTSAHPHSGTADIRDPYRVAPDTWVIPELVPAAPGTLVPLTSLVITGAEPIIVDTGNELSRREWLDAAFSVVDPNDVKWVFLSHDDHDHSGNLTAVLELCPNATLVTTHFTVERTAPALYLSAARKH